MPLLQKKHFRWKEPKEFIKLQDEFERSKVKWWHQPLAALVVAAFLLASWFIARYDPNKQPLPLEVVVPLAFWGGVFFAYVVPWLIALCPSEVHLYDTFLMRVRGNTGRRIKYADIESFSWGVRDDFATLILKRGSGDSVLLGVPMEISRDAVSQFLTERCVPRDATV